MNKVDTADYSLAFVSGIAAISGIFALLKSGDHVVTHLDFYPGTRHLLKVV
jgi:cystathionine beta-lyase/cystathionine gamma-synthase